MIGMEPNNKKGNKMGIKLGSKVQDIYTGFEGLAIAKTEWLYGCNNIGIQPLELDKDGNIGEILWFDEQRVEVIEESAAKYSASSTAETGGPHDNQTAPAH
jgi:hypothetical protein